MESLLPERLTLLHFFFALVVATLFIIVVANRLSDVDDD